MWSTYNPDHAPHLEALYAPLSDVQPNGDDPFSSSADVSWDDIEPSYGSQYHAIIAMGRDMRRHMEQRSRPRVAQEQVCLHPD